MRCVGALLVGILALGSRLQAESDDPPQPPSPDPVTGEQLLRQLPKGVPSIIVRKDQSVWWDDSKGVAYRFAPVDVQENVVLVTDIGQLAVPEKLVESNRIDCLEALPGLIAAASAAKLPAGDLVVADSILVGVHLISSDAIVLQEGVLRRIVQPLGDRAAEVAEVAHAADALTSALAGSGLDAPARLAVAELLAHLSWPKDHPQESDEPSGTFVRRLAASGYLAGCGAFPPAMPALTRLQHALERARRPVKRARVRRNRHWRQTAPGGAERCLRRRRVGAVHARALPLHPGGAATGLPLAAA